MVSRISKILAVAMIVPLFIAVSTTVTTAGTLPRKTVIFHADIPSWEIEGYISSWEPEGVVLYKRVPFINGVVFGVPDTVTALALGDDDRVANVVEDHGMDLQAISTAGDGAAGDGAAGDGAAGDGAAGDGAAQNANKPVKVILTSLDSLTANERPHGVLKAIDHPFDPFEAYSAFDSGVVPDVILEAKAKRRLTTLKMAIFDTGVDQEHPKLKRNKGRGGGIIGGIDLVNMIDGIPADGNGHGTHVSGTLVGDKFGLAPGIMLHVVKVLDDNGVGEVSTLVMALQWCIDKSIDIINMSIAYRENHPIVRMAIQKAYEEGIVMIAAAGNHSNWEDDDITSGDGAAGDGVTVDDTMTEVVKDDGSSTETLLRSIYLAGDLGYSPPETGTPENGTPENGTLEYATAGDGAAGDGAAGDGAAGDGAATGSGSTTNPWPVMYPAAYPEVIAVGAIDTFGDVASFSNLGPEVDVMGPGTRIYSAALNKGYGVANGTSMACPHISGAVALMMAMDLGKELGPSDFKSIIRQTANEDGSLNLADAIEEVLKRQ